MTKTLFSFKISPKILFNRATMSPLQKWWQALNQTLGQGLLTTSDKVQRIQSQNSRWDQLPFNLLKTIKWRILHLQNQNQMSIWLEVSLMSMINQSTYLQMTDRSIDENFQLQSLLTLQRVLNSLLLHRLHSFIINKIHAKEFSLPTKTESANQLMTTSETQA